MLYGARMASIISIDGPKGSGKTTIATLLKQRLPGIVSFSLDEIRRSIPEAIPTEEYNTIAFSILLQHVMEQVNQQKDVLIDSGLTEERSLALKEAIRDSWGKWHGYALTAPHDVLLARLKQRDQANKRRTNEERFERSYDRQQQKSFDGVTIIDTTTRSPEEIADQIVKDVRG